MSMCKKFKPGEGVSFVNAPVGDCAGCVYFSAANCGAHQSNPANAPDEAARFF